MEDLSPGCKRHPDYEIAVSFNILIPNKNAGVMLRHSSSLFYYFLSLFVRLHITIATITRIIPNISPADKVSLYSITLIRVAATGSTDAKIEAFPLSKFLRPAVYRQNASTVLKNQISNLRTKFPCFPKVSLPELPFLMQVFSLACLLISKKDDNATSIVTQSPLKYCFHYNTNMQSCPA